jgi:hypothetical protein
MLILRVPDNLRVRTVWNPETGDPGAGSIAFVTERGWRVALLVGSTLIPPLLALTRLAHGSWATLIIPESILLPLAAIPVFKGGRGGFYELTSAGELGNYLGRRRPDLAGMQRRRVRAIAPGAWG